MGQGGSISQNKSIILNNWIEMNKNSNIFFNKVTNQQIERHQVLITNKQQLNSYVQRMEDQSSLICRLIYFHSKPNNGSKSNNLATETTEDHKKNMNKPKLLTVQKQRSNIKMKTKSMTSDQALTSDNAYHQNNKSNLTINCEENKQSQNQNYHNKNLACGTAKIYYVYTDRMIPIRQWNRDKIIQVIQGFKKITQKYGLFKVRQNCICQNQRKQIKVWINQNPVSNFPLQLVETEEDMIADLAALLVSKKQKIAKELLDLQFFDQVLQKMVALGHQYDYSHNLMNNNSVKPVQQKVHFSQEYKRQFPKTPNPSFNYAHSSTGSTSSQNKIAEHINNQISNEQATNSLINKQRLQNYNNKNVNTDVKEHFKNIKQGQTTTTNSSLTEMQNNHFNPTPGNLNKQKNHLSDHQSSSFQPIFQPAQVNNFYNVFINTDTSYTVNSSLQNSKYNIINKGTFGYMVHPMPDQYNNQASTIKQSENDKNQKGYQNKLFMNKTKEHQQEKNSNKEFNKTNTNISNLKKQQSPLSSFTPNYINHQQQYSPTSTFGNTAITIPLPSSDLSSHNNISQYYSSSHQNNDRQEISQNTSIMYHANTNKLKHQFSTGSQTQQKKQSNSAKNSLGATQQAIFLNKPMSSYISKQTSSSNRQKTVSKPLGLGPPPTMTQYLYANIEEKNKNSSQNFSSSNKPQNLTQKIMSSQQQNRSKNNSLGGDFTTKNMADIRQKLKTEYYPMQNQISKMNFLEKKTNPKGFISTKNPIDQPIATKRMKFQNNCLTPTAVTYQGRNIFDKNNFSNNQKEFVRNFHNNENYQNSSDNRKNLQNQEQKNHYEGDNKNLLNNTKLLVPTTSKSHHKLSGTKSNLSPHFFDNFIANKNQHPTSNSPQNQFLQNRNVVSQLNPTGKSFIGFNNFQNGKDLYENKSSKNTGGSTINPKKKSFPKYYQQKQIINKSTQKYNAQKSLDQRQNSNKLLQKKNSPAKLVSFDVDRFAEKYNQGARNFNNPYHLNSGNNQKDDKNKFMNNNNKSHFGGRDFTKQIVPQVFESQTCSQQIIPAMKTNQHLIENQNDLHIRYQSESSDQRKRNPSTLEYMMGKNKQKKYTVNQLKANSFQTDSLNHHKSNQATRSNFLEPQNNFVSQNQQENTKKTLKKSNNTCFDKQQQKPQKSAAFINSNPYFSHINPGSSLLVINNKFMPSSNNTKKIYQTDVKKRKKFGQFQSKQIQKIQKMNFRNIQRHQSIDKSQGDNDNFKFYPSYLSQDNNNDYIKTNLLGEQKNLNLKKRSSHHQDDDNQGNKKNNFPFYQNSSKNPHQQQSRKDEKHFTFFNVANVNTNTTTMPLGIGHIQQIKPYETNKINSYTSNKTAYSKKDSINSHDQQGLARTTADQKQKRSMIKITRTSQILEPDNFNKQSYNSNCPSQIDQLHNSDPGYKIQRIAQIIQKQKQKQRHHHQQASYLLQAKLNAMDLKQYPKFKKWEPSLNVYGSLINHNTNFYSSGSKQQHSIVNKNLQSGIKSAFGRKRQEVRSEKDKQATNIHDQIEQQGKNGMQKKIPTMVASQNLQSKKKIRKQVLTDMKQLFGNDFFAGQNPHQPTQQQKQKAKKLQIKRQRQQQERMLQNTSSKDLLIQQKVQKQKQKHAQLKSDLSKLFVDGM